MWISRSRAANIRISVLDMVSPTHCTCPELYRHLQPLCIQLQQTPSNPLLLISFTTETRDSCHSPPWLTNDYRVKKQTPFDEGT
ncbi:hypothetical protein XELAEV_18044386mg [Xenopus laevis]|uniref:Uncharacterized protein n=1 Tax=Xenopus laevis TaxID=8355 RepID=A0A974H3B6_XENLA|nr:hypothetical protein XELAEV_18044386mg [Xenopus laevis]